MFKKYWEVMFIMIAIKILDGRNVKRSLVVSRRDNNEMSRMAETLEGVCERMLDEYNRI